MIGFKKFWTILDNKQKRNFLFIVPLLLFGTVLEVMSLGMVIPLITAIISPDRLNFDFISNFLNLSYFFQNNLILVIIGLVLVVFIFKNLYLIFLYSQFIKFATSLEASVSNTIYSKYLHQPYIFFIKNKSSNLISNLTAETRLFTNSYTIPIFFFIVESLVVISIFILILFLSSRSLLFLILFMGVVGLILSTLLRKNVKKWGEIRSTNDNFKVSYLQQGIESIKQTLMQNNQNLFINNFKKHIDSNADVTNKSFIVSQLPRILYEILGIIALLCFITVLVTSGKLNSQSLIELGFYVAVAYRIVPSLNKILVSYQQLKFSDVVLGIISKELKLDVEKNNQPSKNIDFNNIIKVKNLSFYYPDSKIKSLNNINLEITKGDFIGIKGESGSGKTTLLDTIIGLLEPHSGFVEVDDHNIYENIYHWRSKIGYVPQSTLLIDDTIKNNISFGIKNENIDEDRIFEVVKLTRLDKLINNLSEGINSQVGHNGSNLSGGEKQRIGIARALYLNPEILAMDEPTSSLDTKTEVDIIDSINGLIGKKTIIVVSHRDSLISRCNKIFKINDGKLIE